MKEKDTYGENAEDYGEHKYFEGYDEAKAELREALTNKIESL